mgnify:CR=1 FL=1
MSVIKSFLMQMIGLFGEKLRNGTFELRDPVIRGINYQCMLSLIWVTKNESVQWSLENMQKRVCLDKLSINFMRVGGHFFNF